MKNLTLRIIFGFILLAMITACGQSGPLYLPAPPKPHPKKTTNPPSAPTKPAAEVTPATLPAKE